MTEDKVLEIVSDFIRDNLRVFVDIRKSTAYYESDSVIAKVYLGDDLIVSCHGDISL